MKLVRSGLLAAIACLAPPALAQQALEIISLKHRTVDQVVQTLRPLLEPGATMTGQSNQLMVRTSPSNLAEIRRALEALDRPARRLQISVRFDATESAASQGIEGGGRLGAGENRIHIRARDGRGSSQERVDQRLQVVEGGRAFIATGQSRTLPQRQIIRTPAGTVAQETIFVQETASGFEVVPRVSGSTVFLDIAPQREAPGPGGAAQSQRLATSVSARLGEWIDLGGASQGSVRDERAIASASRGSASESRAVWVKVEEIGN